MVKYSLRCTPDRIVIGEVRDGAAKDLLDAWITGHPGECGTVHGEDSRRALERLSELAREGAGGVAQHRMVAQAVHSLIVIKGHGARRKVTEIVRIVGNEEVGCSTEMLPKQENDSRSQERTVLM